MPNTKPEEVAASAQPPAKESVQDLEIKDAQLIFTKVWSELEEKYGCENLRFPKEIFWLNGAPGAGKGTNTRFIMEYRDLTANPVVISDLLKSPEAQKMMNAGLLVGDQEVTRLMLEALLDPVNVNGVVVDGYPRTKTQVECLKLFYRKLNDLRTAYWETEFAPYFEKPKFHIIVLFVDEGESVRRQILRGKKILEHNQEVDASGMGMLKEARKTDLSEESSLNRYRTFKEVTYEALLSLQEIFHYHYINAHGSLAEVQSRIIRELGYQSSLELKQNTFDRLNALPLATQVSVHARQELVRRLDEYEERHGDLFKQVVDLISEKFISIIARHNISGMCRVNSEDPVFENSLALAMALDVFSERGYKSTVDVRKTTIPVRVDKESFEIITETKKVFRFIINFPGSDIRRGR